MKGKRVAHQATITIEVRAPRNHVFAAMRASRHGVSHQMAKKPNRGQLKAALRQAIRGSGEVYSMNVFLGCSSKGLR